MNVGRLARFDRARPARRLWAVAVLGALLAAPACGRSNLLLGGEAIEDRLDGAAQTAPEDARAPLYGLDATLSGSGSPAGTDAALSEHPEPPPSVSSPTASAGPEPVPPTTTSSPPPSGSADPGRPSPSCTPRDEICNGRDDDCDGDVDEVTPVPCPGGGERYCIAGKMSECPHRCDVCIPGSRRVCFLSYCTFWGEQTCAADGRSFGRCREDPVPRECQDVSDTHQNSPQLEQCCLDNGYCCVDEFDLDGDGNHRELLGRCDDVLCQ